MIQYEGIHHVSLAVRNLEKTLRFYREVLGFEELKRPDFDFPGAWLQVGSQQIHLIVNEDGQTIRQDGSIDSRDGHFAIRVKSFQETVEHLEKYGVAHSARLKTTAGFSQIYCCDPDGNVIELNAAY